MRWDTKAASTSVQSSRWPRIVLASILTSRREAVDLGENGFAEWTPITIHFDGSIESRVLRGKEGFKGSLFAVYPGDLVFSKIDARNGAVGLLPRSISQAVVTAEYPVYQVNEDRIVPEYLALFLQTTGFGQSVNDLVSGTSGRKRVQPDVFVNLPIPLPPLETQRAIVARWQAAQVEIAALQQQALAVENEREREFGTALGITNRTDPQKPSNPRPSVFAARWKDLGRWGVGVVSDTLLGLDRLPICAFRYVSLGTLAKVSYGIQKSPANRPGEHARPYLRVANVRKGYLDLSEIKEINVPDSEMDTFRLEKGDILFVEGNGSRAELGRVAMWNGEIPDCVHQNHLIKVRVDRAQLMPDFAMAWFNTEVGRRHFFLSAKTSSGLGTINSEEVRRAPIPLPPLDVQREIVRQVEAGRAEVARLRDRAAQCAKTARTEIEAAILGNNP